MILRNKKTGEIREIKEILIDGMFNVSSLAELNEEWEDSEEWKDYEEPNYYWFISGRGTIEHDKDEGNYFDEGHKELGNYFKTKEEAEKVVEKLKAWKRLKDKGFRFVGWQDSGNDNDPDMCLFKIYEDGWGIETCEDICLLFGGKE